MRLLLPDGAGYGIVLGIKQMIRTLVAVVAASGPFADTTVYKADSSVLKADSY